MARRGPNKLGVEVLKVPVRLTLSRGLNSKQWRLVIEDVASATQVIEVKLDGEGFADLMSSCSTSATAELVRSQLHGKKLETKRVSMPCPKMYPKNFTKLQAQWAKELETEGWFMDLEDSFNGHRFSGEQYEVCARRWV